MVIGMETCLSGVWLRVTLTWTEPPSGAVYIAEAKLMVTWGSSSSVMETATLPALIPP